MGENDETVALRFKELCNEAIRIDEEYCDERHNEPYFLKILEYVKSLPQFRPLFLSLFIAIVRRELRAPHQLTCFCMRELQWPEIKKTAYEIASAQDPRTMNAMSDILWVYEPEWPNADLYEYYS